MITFGLVKLDTVNFLQVEFDSWESLPNISLPDGGSEDAVNENSVLEIFSAVEHPRQWYLMNLGSSSVRLFHKQVESVITPFILSPGEWAASSPENARLALFAWSEGSAGLVSGSFYSRR